MYTQPMIFPLNADGKLYLAQDDQGQVIGTGTREVCEALIHILRRAKELEPVDSKRLPSHVNVRSAIMI